MKKSVVVLLLLVLSAVFFSFYQTSNEDDKIYWDAGKRLAWNDYKASPDYNDTSNSALTFYGISSVIKTKKDTAAFQIKSMFDIQKSWVKPEDKTDTLLHHEQGHFDIAEVYARKLKKTVHDYTFKKATLGTDFNTIYKKNSEALNTQQGIYDEETDHGRIFAKQKEWNEKIQREIKELDLYDKPLITVHFSL